MSLVKNTAISKIESLNDGTVVVVKTISISDGEDIISKSIHRHSIAPGDDCSNEDSRVQAICAATHTPEVIEAYKAAIAAQGV